MCRSLLSGLILLNQWQPKLTYSSQQVPLSPGLMNVVLHLVVRSTSRHQVTLAHRWKKGSVSRISRLAKRQKSNSPLKRQSYSSSLLVIASPLRRLYVFTRSRTNFWYIQLLRDRQTTVHVFLQPHNDTQPVLTFTTTALESPSELKNVTLRLLSRIKNPKSYQKLKKFRLVFLTLCHLPLPRLRRHVSFFFCPAPCSLLMVNN